MKFPLYTVDAFSNIPFAGNPAAVCLLNEPNKSLSDELLQKIATEMNISETAFIKKLNEENTFEKGSRFGLRWFSPTVEVPLCGHATLASAAILFYCYDNPSDEIVFETLSGDLIARRREDTISLVLPLNTPIKETDEDSMKLCQMIAGDLPVHDVQYSERTMKMLIRLEDDVQRSYLEAINAPISLMMAAHDGQRVKGVIITLKGSESNGAVDANGKQYDFVSRYFAPWNGINEDPVTGSAHTVLGGYWSHILGKTSMYARQCSSRGGDLHVHILNEKSVEVAGPATIVVKGSINIPL